MIEKKYKIRRSSSGCLRTRKRKNGLAYQAIFERKIGSIIFFKARTFSCVEMAEDWLNKMNSFLDSQKNLFLNKLDEKFILETINRIKWLIDSM